MKRYFIVFVLGLVTAGIGCKKYKQEDKPVKEKKWVVTTVAGDGTGGFADGAALSAKFNNPADVAVATDGTIYVTDANNHRIRKITGDRVSTLAGSDSGIVNGTGASAKFIFPYSITLGADGNLYLSDLEDSRIRKINPAAVATTYAGTDLPFFGDGPVATALFNYDVEGIAADAQGNIYIADTQNQRIRKINVSGQVSTVAGSDTAASRDGTVAMAQFFLPGGIAIDKQGNIYITEPYHFRIRKITPAGEVSTFAGSGIFDHADGDAGTARFRFPQDIVIDSKGNLYVADDYHIRKISPQGVVSTIAGSDRGFADGDGVSAKFYNLTGLGIDAHDNLYVADFANNRIRKISFE